jgi:hypothetical protein
MYMNFEFFPYMLWVQPIHLNKLCYQDKIKNTNYVGPPLYKVSRTLLNPYRLSDTALFWDRISYNEYVYISHSLQRNEISPFRNQDFSL